MFYLFHQKEDEAAANISVMYLIRNCHDLPWNQAGFSEQTGWPHLRSGRSSSQQERFRKPIHLFREILMSIPDSNLFSDGPYICVEIYLSPQPFNKIHCALFHKIVREPYKKKKKKKHPNKPLSWQLLVWMKSFNCCIFEPPRKITSKIDVLWQKSLRYLKTRTNRKQHH